MARGHAAVPEGQEWHTQDSHSRSNGSGFGAELPPGLPSVHAPDLTVRHGLCRAVLLASPLCVLKPPGRRHHRLHHLGTVALWLSPSPDGAT